MTATIRTNDSVATLLTAEADRYLAKANRLIANPVGIHDRAVASDLLERSRTKLLAAKAARERAAAGREQMLSEAMEAWAA